LQHEELEKKGSNSRALPVMPEVTLTEVAGRRSTRQNFPSLSEDVRQQLPLPQFHIKQASLAFNIAFAIM
jgi:hypothetical protein